MANSPSSSVVSGMYCDPDWPVMRACAAGRPFSSRTMKRSGGAAGMASHGSSSSRPWPSDTVISFQGGPGARMSVGGSLNGETCHFPGRLENV